MKILRNPLFRIVGIIVIIYLALFRDNESEDNLRNRLSKEKIKDNAVYIKDKAIYIKDNIKKSQENIDKNTDDLTNLNSENSNNSPDSKLTPKETETYQH